jgi:hypothetical protein
VLIASCVAAGAFLVIFVTQVPHTVTQDSEGWGVLIFRYYFAPFLAGGSLVFGVIPSALLFWKGGRGKRDRLSLCISGGTLGVIVLTWLLIEPLRHLLIFVF